MGKVIKLRNYQILTCVFCHHKTTIVATKRLEYVPYAEDGTMAGCCNDCLESGEIERSFGDR